LIGALRRSLRRRAKRTCELDSVEREETLFDPDLDEAADAAGEVDDDLTGTVSISARASRRTTS
jgi:hypothetical protein